MSKQTYLTGTVSMWLHCSKCGVCPAYVFGPGTLLCVRCADKSAGI